MQNRRKFLVQSTLAAGALTFLKPLKGFALFSSGGEFSASKTVTILHTANLNGKWEASNGFGGLKGITQAITDIRKQNKNVIVLDAGDSMNGTINAETNIAFLAALKTAGYDAIVPGNKEMVNGNDNFGEVIERSGVNVVATNYYKQDRLSGTVLPYHIIKKGCIKVGIVSLANTTKVKAFASSSLATNVALINNTAAFLKQNHDCKLIVCITHEAFTQKNCNLTDDISFANLTTGVDVIISGTQTEGVYKTSIVKNKKAEDVIISTSGEYGSVMGRIDITYNVSNDKVAVETNQIIICAEKNKSVAFRKYAASLNVA